MADLTESEIQTVKQLEDAKEELASEQEEILRKCKKVKERIKDFHAKCDHKSLNQKVGNIYICDDCGKKVRKDKEK